VEDPRLEILHIRPATSADLPHARAMLREYVEWIGLDLAFQEIDTELEGLPGDYAPPRGALFVAVEGPRYLAMIALRPLDRTTAEMKRLYVRPEARGRGLARQLITRLCDEARRLNYSEIRLDTLPKMGEAQAIYETYGFVDIEPYYETPIAGTRFMSKKI
jgi:GNAT superfamily N-acetyltransferase